MDIDLISDSCEISDTESPQQINDMLLDNVAIDQSEDKIKKKKPQSSSVPEQDTPSPDDVDSPDDFEMDDAPSVNVSEKENEEEEEKKEKKQIKEIINHKVNSRGKIQYMVKYKGKYPNEWVDEEDLIDNSDLIAEYMKSETSKPPKEEKIDLKEMEEILEFIKNTPNK